MSTLRIAHITATFPPYWGGTGNVAYYNSLELARRGHEVHVFTAQYPLNGYHDPQEIIVHRLWTPFRVGNAPLTPTILYTLRGYDLIHLHWPFIFGVELTWLSTLLSHIPYVMTYHLDLSSKLKWIFGLYQRIWGPILTQNARKILAVTKEHLQSTQVFSTIKDRPQDICEIPNGVDIELFNPDVSQENIRSRFGIPKDALIIIFVGAMDRAHEYKGIPDLIKAIGLLNNSKIWLLLVGDGELLPTYQVLASQLPKETIKQLIFVGSVVHFQLPGYYSSSDLCIMPSRQPESFGMVLVEAMACGKPVIASESPGVRSVVSDGVDGLLFKAGDITDLVDKIQQLLRNPDQRVRMGLSGRAKVEAKYSWPKVVDRLEKVYYSVVDERYHGGNQ